jgi:NAD(P)-dependent dehydrogenase (short-subunit alcohol dehydrogenase family)
MVELAPRKIRVNVLTPGPTDTPGLANAVPPEQRRARLEGLAAGVPLGRLGEPSEIASAALFLATDASSFVNGAELFADGGQAQV